VRIANIARHRLMFIGSSIKRIKSQLSNRHTFKVDMYGRVKSLKKGG
jgi:hypothetical protein